MSQNQVPGDLRSSEGIWDRLCQITVKGAEYDSRERQPHPKCLEGTREDLLKDIYRLLDNREKNRLIWLHATAGVGKSAVAFTVAEKMKSLKVVEETHIEKRLAGTFFFSRNHTERCTTGYFFATLAYQLACNFPSVKGDVNRAIREDPGLLDPNKSLRAQIEGLFLRPLRNLQLRLRDCPPLTFVVDALDECTSEAEVADLISLLARALHDSALPKIHIILTSRSKDHIREAIQKEEVREIPGETAGEDVAAIISLDGVDVDNDIYVFLEHSFTKLRGRFSTLPYPTTDELAQLASRAGRRFIVASTIMKFIDDDYHDPRERLLLMLKFTSELLPGTEVYKLYYCILITFTEPARAYRHLSVVASLANPLPISQISELLGPGEGKDVEAALVQLRSVMDIPADSGLPVTIYHSSVRGYISDPSRCSLPEVQDISHPHTLLAHSCFCLMIRDIPTSTALLDVLSELKRQSQAHKMRLAQRQSPAERLRQNVVHYEPQTVNHLLSFMVQPLESLQVLISMLWLGRTERLDLLFWLGTLDGYAWLQTFRGRLFLGTPEAEDWVLTRWGQLWLQTPWGMEWLQSRAGKRWLKVRSGLDWLQTASGRDWLQTRRDRAEPQTEKTWLQTQNGQRLLLHTERGQGLFRQDSLETVSGQINIPREDVSITVHSPTSFTMQLPMRTAITTKKPEATVMNTWLQTDGGQDWLQTQIGQDWLLTQLGRTWLQTQSAKKWLQTPGGQAWQSTPVASVWVAVEEFASASQAIKEYMFIPELSSLPAFQAIKQFESLPDFMKFPVFLALRQRDNTTHALPQGSVHAEIIHTMKTLASFAHETRERSRSASGALDYACQSWAFHLSRAPSPWDNMLNRRFQSFWNCYLLCWLEKQWCSKGLRSCLPILFEGQKLVLPDRQNPELSEGQELAKDHVSIGKLSILCLAIALLLAYRTTGFYMKCTDSTFGSWKSWHCLPIHMYSLQSMHHAITINS